MVLKWIALTIVLVIGTVSNAQAEKMKFEWAWFGGNCGKCHWLSALGEIVPSTPQDLRDFVGSDPIPAKVKISSPGGNLIAGLELGEMFRSAGVSVEVASTRPMRRDDPYWIQEDVDSGRLLSMADAGECFSACVYALIGGKYRSVFDENGKKSKVGVHRFRVSDDSEATAPETGDFSQIVVGIISESLIKSRIDPALLPLINGTASDDMRELDYDHMIQLGLINTEWRSEEWNIYFKDEISRAFTQSTIGDDYWARLEFERSSQDPTGHMILRMKIPNESRVDESFFGYYFGIRYDDREEESEYVFSKEHTGNSVSAHFGVIDTSKKMMSGTKVEISGIYSSMAAAHSVGEWDIVNPNFSLSGSSNRIRLVMKDCPVIPIEGEF